MAQRLTATTASCGARWQCPAGAGLLANGNPADPVFLLPLLRSSRANLLAASSSCNSPGHWPPSSGPPERGSLVKGLSPPETKEPWRRGWRPLCGGHPMGCFGWSWSRGWAHRTQPVWSWGCSDRGQLHHLKKVMGAAVAGGPLRAPWKTKQQLLQRGHSCYGNAWSQPQSWETRTKPRHLSAGVGRIHFLIWIFWSAIIVCLRLPPLPSMVLSCYFYSHKFLSPHYKWPKLVWF